VSLIIGEVHTGLLLTSTAVSSDAASSLLAIQPGGSVRTRQRPVRYAWSPDVLTGVDCLAPVGGKRQVRIVGTPATRVSLTEGSILQAATSATFRHDPTGRRHPWGHYLARPGVLEVLGTESEDVLGSGFLCETHAPTMLDLGAVNVRTLAAIQRSNQLDHIPPFHTRRTRLRWSAKTGQSKQQLIFTLGAKDFRTVRLLVEDDDQRSMADFCADLALHDWLLSTLVDLVDHAVAKSRPARELIAMLRPSIDHLVHAWMPAAHASKSFIEIWQEFDSRSGFSLQWQKTVERIRDQLSVGIIEAMQPFTQAGRSEPR
jgi:hypothetical protein